MGVSSKRPQEGGTKETWVLGCGGNQGPWPSPSPRAPHAQQVSDPRTLVCSHLLPSSLSQEPCPGSRGKVLPGLPPIPHRPPKGSRGHAQPALPCSPLLWYKAFQLWAPLSSGERSTGASTALGSEARGGRVNVSALRSWSVSQGWCRTVPLPAASHLRQQQAQSGATMPCGRVRGTGLGSGQDTGKQEDMCVREAGLWFLGPGLSGERKAHLSAWFSCSRRERYHLNDDMGLLSWPSRSAATGHCPWPQILVIQRPSMLLPLPFHCTRLGRVVCAHVQVSSYENLSLRSLPGLTLHRPPVCLTLATAESPCIHVEHPWGQSPVLSPGSPRRTGEAQSKPLSPLITERSPGCPDSPRAHSG